MAYPSGIGGATQRIDEIRRTLASFEKAPVPEALQNSDGNDFSDVLNEKLMDAPQEGTSLDNQSDIEDMVESQAQKTGLDPALVKAVVKAESGFNPNATSPVGAKGLMQLMPSTAQSLGVRSILDPEDNVKGGTQYLKSLMQKYHSVPNALAAYNAGPGAVDKYGGIPPYKETQTYVQRVLGYQHQYEQQQQAME